MQIQWIKPKSLGPASSFRRSFAVFIPRNPDSTLSGFTNEPQILVTMKNKSEAVGAQSQCCKNKTHSSTKDVGHSHSK